MKYEINIDQLIKVWQNNIVEVEFDGDETALEEHIKNIKGNVFHSDKITILNVNHSESFVDSEEYMDEFEIQSIDEV
jgi:hypothetical protein